MTTAQPAEPRRPFSVAAISMAVFSLTLFWRSPALFLAPRVWAEEGHLYLARMIKCGPIDGLLLVVNGNYQFLTNLFVEIARLAPVRDFAVATTYLSLLLTLTAVGMVSAFLRARGLPWIVSVVAAVLMALLPSGYEVYLTATNVQWVCSLAALMIGLSEELPAAKPKAIVRYAGLAACGLTGLPSCILGPVLLVLALRRRTAFGWAIFFTIAGTVAVIAAHRGDVARPFNLTPGIVGPFALHTIFTAFLPVSLVDALAEAAQSRLLRVDVAMAGAAGLALIAWAAWDSLGAFLTLLLAGAAVGASFLNEIGALGTVSAMLSGWNGGRYFFLAGCCVAVLLAAGLASSNGARRATAAALVALALATGLPASRAEAWTGIFLAGPSVADQVDACPAETSCRVQEWPVGAGLWVTVRP